MDDVRKKAIEAAENAFMDDFPSRTFEEQILQSLEAYEAAMWQDVDPKTIPRNVQIYVWNDLTKMAYPRLFADREPISINVTKWRPLPKPPQ